MLALALCKGSSTMTLAWMGKPWSAPPTPPGALIPPQVLPYGLRFVLLDLAFSILWTY